MPQPQVPPLHPPASAAWYVSNRSRIVGPVSTDLLLRGVCAGRVPEGSLVARPRWVKWRELEGIREVCALRRLQARRFVGHTDWSRVTECWSREQASRVSLRFARAFSLDDVFQTLLSLAIEHTRAQFGLLHRSLPPHVGLVTTHASGAHLRGNLGEIIAWHDPAREIALGGGARLGDPGRNDWARASARRLSDAGEELKSVVACPVKYDQGPRALLELGRRDHAFRREDLASLGKLVDYALIRSDQLIYRRDTRLPAWVS